MSDGSGQGEQEQLQEQTPKWGDSISEERQVELDTLAELQRTWAEQPEATRGVGPLQDIPLTGADVFWLAKRALADPEGDADELAVAERRLRLPNIYFVRSTLHLERADLGGAYLQGAALLRSHLEGANLQKAQLEGANLGDAHLERADLGGAYLQGANLGDAHLERADLGGAYLQGAVLLRSHLEGANLRQAHLEGTNLRKAHLEGADLVATWFDKASDLNDAILTGISLDQASFDNTNLTVVDWSLVDILGDERTARTPIDTNGKPKDRQTRLDEYKSAVRANRVLSVALQAQGLTDDASRFAYRAQVLQRKLYRRQRQVGAYLFSLLIAALSGYGYRLGRILIVYGLSLAVFAAAYFTAGQWFGATHLTWYQAILVSLTAIHGRVFFESFGLNSIQSWIAAIESVVGIVIEGVFVAMLIQRFFGR